MSLSTRRWWPETRSMRPADSPPTAGWLAAAVALSGLGAVTALVPWSQTDAIAVVIFGVACAGLGTRHLWSRRRSARTLWRACVPVVVAAFVLRAGVGALHQWFELVPELYRLDVDTYNSRGWAIAQAWANGEGYPDRAVSLNTAVHQYLTAALFTVVGHSVLAINVVSALVGALSLYYLFATATELLGRRAALWVVLLVAAWPSHVLWTSLNYREPWVFYLLARAIHSTVRWLVRGGRREWVKALVFVAALTLFRTPTGILVGAAVLAVSGYRAVRRASWPLRFPAGLAVTACLGTLGLSLGHGWFSPFAFRISPVTLTGVRRGLATGGAAFYPDLVYHDWSDVLAFLPLGLLHLLLAPFPWQLTNLAQLGSAVENLFLAGLIAAAAACGWRTRWREGWSAAFVAIVAAAGLTAFAVVEGNLGTAYRHKMQFLPYLLILLALAWSRGGMRGHRPSAPAVEYDQAMGRDRPPARVLHALTTGTLGGTELMTLRLVTGLDQRRFSCEVSILTGWGETADRLVAIGVPVHRLAGERSSFGALLRLCRLLRAGRYDILHLYGFRASWLGRLAARTVRPRPTVIHAIRGLHVTEGEEVTRWKTRLALTLERFGARLVDAYIANSCGAVRFLTSRGLPGEKFFAVPNGIESADWDPGRNGEGLEPPIIICVANFRPVKRHGDLLEAVALLQDRGLKFRCLLVGDGPTRRRVETMARALNLTEVVEFLGSQPPAKVDGLLRRAAVFALVSLWEGLPASVLEAMAVGLPVVGTDVPGISEVVLDGTTGCLVPPRRPAELAARLERLLADRSLRIELGRAGQRRVREAFSLERMVRGYEDVYARLISR